MDVPEFNYNEDFTWKPPEQHGLSNSQEIIPCYYKSDKKILNIDYLLMIHDDIRNYRPLNQYQLDYIKKRFPEKVSLYKSKSPYVKKYFRTMPRWKRFILRFLFIKFNLI